MSVNVDNNKCTGCGACVDICPVNAIEIKEQKAIINDTCIECGFCVSQCSLQALSM